MKRLSAIFVVLVVAGCSAGAKTAGSAGPGQAGPTVQYDFETPEPASGNAGASSGDVETAPAKLGETVRILCDGDPCLDVTVLSVKFSAAYGSGYSADKPETSGDVFLAARVRYKALGSGADYNEFDWQAFVGDEAVSDFAIVVNGPKPELTSGTLPKGKSVTGYLFWEVPKRGRVTIAYGGNSYQAPVFEVVLRSK